MSAAGHCRRGFALLLAATLGLAARVAGQEPEIPASRFVLDYDVPESPAFVALGVTPAAVVRGGASKPLAANLLGQVSGGGALGSGVALDFAPYFVFHGRLESVQAYRRSFWKRALANLQASFASIADEADTSALRIGIGARVTVLDRQDLLADERLAEDIAAALTAQANADRAGAAVDDEVGAPVVVTGLREAYTRAKERVRTTPGAALSVGWGVAGRLRGAVASPDSADVFRHHVWIAYRYRFASGTDLLAGAQWRAAEASAGQGRLRSGAAVRANGLDWNFALELYYESESGTLSAGRIGIGGNGEWRFADGFGLVAALTTEPVETAGGTVMKLRARTAVRWNAGGG